MLALLNVLGSDVQGEACAVLSEDFCSVLLSLARLLRDTGDQTWRQSASVHSLLLSRGVYCAGLVSFLQYVVGGH